VSLQIAILKVLSSHPDGRASVGAIKSDLAVLTASGRDWSERVRRLASRAPNLDIFTQGLVRRDSNGWEIAPEGRDFLRSLERPTIDDLSDKSLMTAEKRPTPQKSSRPVDHDELQPALSHRSRLPSRF
jgi:hypothetical protein